MAFARRRAITVTADGANNQTGWNSVKYGGIVTITAVSMTSNTITLQRRDAAGTITDVTDDSGTAITYTKAGTYKILANNANFVQGDYRLNAKAAAVATFPFTMAIEGR